ncbi:ribosome assembly factor SBDS [Candidatus Woesearchaeota archaeon]|nr:ribosome assembly factor SBDS [Candidatus Woesearchaeota archaeon]
MQRSTFGKEKVSFSIARLKKEGHNFEIAVNPDLALDFRNRKPVNVEDVLVDQKIFSDAKKGMVASEHEVKKIFKTENPIEVAEIILKNGEVHLTAEYKTRMLEEKRKRIMWIIHANGVDPRTHAPHPLTRIENAFEEAKVRIDEHKSAEDQVQDILKALRPILPIKFEVKKVEIMLPAKYAGKLHLLAKGFARIIRQDWQGDGSLKAVVEVPGGLEQDFYEKINNLTHGSVETKVLAK